MKKFRLLLVAFFAMVGMSAFAQNRAALATDGTTAQYFYNVDAGGFLIGANDYGTRASIDSFNGYLCRFEANGETFKLADKRGNDWNDLDCQNVNQIWVDGKGRGGAGLWKYNINADGTFTISNTNVAGFLSVLPSQGDTRLYMSEAAEAQSTWIAVSEEYFKELTATPITKGDKIASVAGLAGKVFLIQNDADDKALCFATGNQELKYESTETAYSSPSFMFKIEAAQGEGVEDYYYIRTLKPDGSEYTSPWGGSYLNSQPADGSTSFVLNNRNGNNVNGQDINNGAVWDIQYEEGKGFTIKNIGTGLYLNDNAPAKYEEPVYWSFIEATPGKALIKSYVPAATAALALQGQDMPASFSNALDAAINQYGPVAVFVSESLDAAALAVGIEALEKAVKEANSYVGTKKALDKYGELAAGLDEAGKAAFDVSAIQAAYDAQTLTEDKSADIVKIFYDAVRKQNTVGANMTGAIINPSFEEANGIGWTMEAGNKNMHGGLSSNFCAESWHATFTLSQTIKDMPKGKYTLTAQGFYGQDGSDNDNLPVFYANDVTTTFKEKTGTESSMSMASESFTSGLYKAEPIEFEVGDDGIIILGAKLETNTTLWCCWDNFELTFQGDDTATAINEVAKKDMQKVIFNAAGQRINTLQKGINIVGGKKVYIK